MAKGGDEDLPMLPKRFRVPSVVALREGPEPDSRGDGNAWWRWDPGLRQAPVLQQHAEVAGILAVGLGSPFGTPQRRVSAGSARWASGPAACSSSTTKRQPVVASRAKAAS